MGTVGLSFGSATSGQGFDVASTVTQILAASQAIENPWKAQLTTLHAQDAAFTSLGSDLSALTTSLQSLTDFTGILAQKQGSSSNTSLLQLTGATANATAGSHTVVISKLAQNSSNYADAVTNASDTLSGSIGIQVGSGAVQPVSVPSGSTLSTLATTINQAGVGVTASVITDNTGSRLSLVSSTPGAAGQLAITGSLTDATTSTALSFHTGLAGQDASFTVDGITLASSSNTVVNAIPGVTFQLLASNASTPVQVQVATDTSAITASVGTFVSAYNKVVGDIKTQSGKDASGNAEPLYGSPILSSIQQQITSALYAGTPSGSISSITQLGITSNTDGTLALNTETLQGALTSHFADVTGFLQNTNSFGKTFGVTLDGLGAQNPLGTVSLAITQNTSAEKSLNDDVAAEDTRLAAQKITLTNQLNAANQILQGIPAQINSVNEIYSAITGYSKTAG